MDEHVSSAVTDGLRRRGVEVLTVQEAHREELDDDDQLRFAFEGGWCVFTQDADFLRLHARGIPHSGIVYAPQGTGVGTIVRGLMLVYELLSPDDMVAHVEFL